MKTAPTLDTSFDIASRRSAIAMIVGGACAWLLPASRAKAGRQDEPSIPQKVSARVIVDNDFAGDPDGLVALAHQLLAPKTRTVLVTTTTLDPKLEGNTPADRGAAAGRDLARELIKRAGIAVAPPVVAGPEISESAKSASAAARAIVAEALRDDPLPLFFTCGGPLTNLAAALRLEPKIAQRMTAIWIGGAPYPQGGWEYNLAVDADAARQVIERSRIPLWQVPQDVYGQMQISIAELKADMRSISPFARWIYEQFTHPPDWVDLGGTWPLGDSPLVLLTAISAQGGRFREMPARRIGSELQYAAEIPDRMIRVYETVDVRLTWADFLARLRLAYQEFP